MTSLWVERTGNRRYTGNSSRGVHVLTGPETETGVFTPGELLKIALAACSGMSSDEPLVRRLGADYRVRIEVGGLADWGQERYPVLEEKMVIDLGGLTGEERQRALAVVERAIDHVCSVGRTLKAGAEVNVSIEP